MTTEDLTTVDESTETETSPRPLGVLLSLGTYQGMTDEEIQSIIDYNVELTERSTEAMTWREQAQQNMEYNTEVMRESTDFCQSMLESIFKGTTHYVEPTLETVTE